MTYRRWTRIALGYLTLISLEIAHHKGLATGDVAVSLGGLALFAVLSVALVVVSATQLEQ